VARFFDIAAKILTAYALLHPAVHLGLAAPEPEPPAAGWTVAEGAGEFAAVSADGTPVLYQHVYRYPVPPMPETLAAPLTSIALLAAGAVLNIASKTAPTERRPRAPVPTP